MSRINGDFFYRYRLQVQGDANKTLVADGWGVYSATSVTAKNFVDSLRRLVLEDLPDEDLPVEKNKLFVQIEELHRL